MIPNLVYGKGISGAVAYVMGQGNDAQTGERLELVPGEKARAILLGGQGFGFEIDSPERLDLARRVMEWQGLPENQGSRTRKQELDCLHASLSWGDGQTPNREEMLQAGAEFLAAIGLEKARAIFVQHDDTDHAHLHIVASRIDPETGKTLRVDYDKAASQKWALDWERAHGQERAQGQDLHGLRDAVQGRDIDAVLAHMTRDRSTFEPWQLNRALQYGGLEGEARDQFRGAILGHANTIGLRESAEEPVTRYTTRQTLAEEMGLQRSAARLAANERHGIDAGQLDRAAERFTLKPEQDAALRQLTGDGGLAILWGEAGTGKSHTLNAARAAYEAAGKTVIGLAWTNDVAQQMRGDGFDQAATVARELGALEKGRTHWTRDTVLIVDEAAMLSTGALGRLASAADRAGAKLILAGDDAQLGSIERGGMFETLRQTHGAAVLSEVQRVKEADQQAAFNQMHGREFLQALQTFDKAGGVHWTTRPSDTLKEMAARYTADVAADDGKKRFMFAYTNKDVAALNAEARALHKARGDLGEDRSLATKTGAQDFAEGDRIQFTGNGRTQRAREAGLVNGRVGTIEALTIDGEGRASVTVALDAKKGQEPPRVSFTVGEDARAGEFNSFKHGYAGTIYRGQGRTLDQSYVAYSQHMRASAAYVALTRHREGVELFAARETVKDLEAMARAMSRTEGKRAATAYAIDPAARLDIAQALDAAERSPPEHSSAEAVASNVEAGIAQAAEFVAGAAERAIETLAGIVEGLLGGGSSTPAPKPSEPALNAKEARAAKRKATLAAEQEHRANLQTIARSLGAGDALTPEELQREKEAQEKRNRDRGGGQSL